MSEGAALFARTFVIGIAVAAPVGAMGVLCIQRTLARGWWIGFATGLGIATADATYAGLAAFGLAALSSSLVALQMPVRVVGGLVLIWLGVRAWRNPPEPGLPSAREAAGIAPAYLSAVGLTLTNPMTIMAFAAVFASAGLVSQPTPGAAAVVTAGVAAGSLAWWLGLTTTVALVRHTLSAAVLRGIDRASAVLVIAFGVYALGGALGFVG